MWWLLTAAAVAAFWLLAISCGFLPPPASKLLIKIHNSQLVVTRGQLRAQSREFVSDIIEQYKITKGYIAITHSKRAAFSRNIPRDIQQRLRNVLLND